MNRLLKRIRNWRQGVTVLEEYEFTSEQTDHPAHPPYPLVYVHVSWRERHNQIVHHAYFNPTLYARHGVRAIQQSKDWHVGDRLKAA